MCGIAGAFAYRAEAPPIDKAELLRVRDAMLARGPDAAGLWMAADGRVGFGHRRLAIIDLSEGGAQPMLDPETGNWICFNGEIYNHQQLRARLHHDGVATRTQSDTEVLLKLYAQRGEEMFSDLRGMYAFAIWDARRRELLLARDPFGIKPLYVADDGATIRFASQVKPLLQAPVDRRPEPAGHAGFLLWGSVPEPYTLYRGIRALPPGHWQRFSAAGAGRPVRFASIVDALGRLPTASGARTDDALDQIAAAVRDSVAAHMVADVPVGVFLSAGLDSTMLAACAASAGELRTLTLGFNEYADGPNDEAGLADEVAGLLHAKHALHRISARDFECDRQHLIDAMDQPSIDGINVWFVSKAAAAQGLKVAISGLGGDELFGSYPSFRQVPRLVSLMRRAPVGARTGLLLRHLAQPFASALPSPKYAGLAEYGHSLSGAYLLRRALHMPWELAQLMDPAMARDGLEELATMNRLDASTEGLESDRLAVSALEMQWYMRNQLLRDADWAGMAHSLEIRVPLVDLQLLQHFVELPDFDANSEKRTIVRRVAPELPEGVLNRPKTGFAVPIHQWLNPGASSGVTRHRDWAMTLYRHFAAA
ncbi:asparagine synthase (glutamine-hydrolyzing) [Bradyrhizobium sp. JR7.2]|uniref:asparagine synthase (glutamine-hydrolyzing) n=1 Tax=Bradyrhizobium barranii TaxID=2992140 RepID=A0ABY3QVK1_9BRAD|nr:MULTISPECIES: asparagine synthase (glutamine-hydrolyzing) [Bradyrhizobium]UFW89514.1 asparagine synthase (glutamine-hydrolyzing) [Bradyrhizobium japonicum]WFT98273.1 asparagine synthase (glutamine-hydrolyzing) [Bradyrhizobium barranii]